MKHVALPIGLVVALALLMVGATGAMAAPTPVSEIDFSLGGTNTSSITLGSLLYTVSSNVSLYDITAASVSESRGWMVTALDANDDLVSGYSVTNGLLSLTSTDGGEVFTLSGNISTKSFTFTGDVDSAVATATTSKDGKVTYGIAITSTDAVISDCLAKLYSPTGPYNTTITFSLANGKTQSGGSIVSVADPVPLPPSVSLFIPGLLGLFGIRKRVRA